MGHKYSEHYTMRTYDYNQEGEIRLTSVMNALQDISTRHFNSVIRPSDVRNTGLWVIVEWQVSFENSLKAVEAIEVVTEPIYFRKFIAYRTYEFFSEKGILLGRAVSKWAYLDIENRRSKTIPESFSKLFGVENSTIKPKREPISTTGLTEVFSQSFTSYDSDVDINRHVNNVVYVRWAVDAYKKASLKAQGLETLKEVTVVYRKEVMAHETVVATVFKDPSQDHMVTTIKNELGEICVELAFKAKA
jgi:acyl-ACP thioesterase